MQPFNSIGTMAQQAQKPHTGNNQQNVDDILSVDITDFGPITKGTLNLKPLTILIGPNGCGKSYIATLAHSIINATHVQPLEIANFDSKSSFNFQTVIQETKHILDEHTAGADTVNSSLFKSYVRHKFQKLDEIMSINFTGGHKSLIRSGKSQFRLDVKSKILRGTMIGAQTIKIKPVNTLKLKVHFNKYKDGMNIDLDNILRINDNTVHLNLPDFATNTLFETTTMPPLLSTALYTIQPDFKQSVYFPAERGGLTLAYRSLTLHLYGNIGLAGTDTLNSDMTNASTNFLSVLFVHAITKTKFAGLVEQFENSALEGNIVVRENAKKSFGVVFRHNDTDFPLSKSSSSVKNLALFFLYLKHMAQEGETLIVEEPEIALHPDNQLLLARLIVKLINAGLHIMVTTHSQYFLEQLSHCAVAGAQPNKNSPSFQSDERLDKDSVAAYSFEKGDGGYVMAPITIDDEGIPQYEFTRVYDKLYNELLGLEKDMDDS